MTLGVAYPGALEGADAAGDMRVQAPGGISRRRLVQGALWATPVVMIATAAPAAAASPARVGGLRLLGHSGYQNTDTLTVMTNVIYVGDGPPSPDHPVSGVHVSIRVPTGRVTATGDGSTTSSGWQYISRTDGGGFATFLYRWNSTDLSGTASTTSQLVAVLPKAAERTAFTIDIQASGTSNTQPVNSSRDPLTIDAYALLTIPNGLVATRPLLFGTRQMQFVAPVWNNQATNAAPVEGLVARITVPTSMVGTGTPTVANGPWSYTSRSTSGNNTIVTYSRTGGALLPSGSSTAATFRIPLVALSLEFPTVSITYEGRSPNAQGALTSAFASDAMGVG